MIEGACDSWFGLHAERRDGEDSVRSERRSGAFPSNGRRLCGNGVEMVDVELEPRLFASVCGNRMMVLSVLQTKFSFRKISFQRA